MTERLISLAQFWCWITSEFEDDRITCAYLWMWLAIFISLAVYGPLCLLMRGNITMSDGSKWWRVKWHWRRQSAGDDESGLYGEASKPTLVLLA